MCTKRGFHLPLRAPTLEGKEPRLSAAGKELAVGQLLISQFGTTQTIGMPDAMVQAMDTVVIERFSADKGIALDGIKSHLTESADTHTNGVTVTTMWLSPCAPISFEYVRGSDDAKTSEHIRIMRQSVTETGRITIR